MAKTLCARYFLESSESLLSLKPFTVFPRYYGDLFFKQSRVTGKVGTLAVALSLRSSGLLYSHDRDVIVVVLSHYSDLVFR